MNSHARYDMTAAILGGVTAAAIISAAVVQFLAWRAVSQRPPIGKKLLVRGRAIQFVDRGSGSCVVILHGNGSMLEDIASSGLIDQLADNNRVVVFDRPGFGESDRESEGTWTPEREADLIAEVLTRLGVHRPIIVGHSWGTLVALSLALRDPTSIAGLVLLSGYYYPTTRLDVALQTPASLPVIGNILRHTVLPLIGRLSAPVAFRKLFKPQSVPGRFLREYSVPLATRPSQLKSSADDTVSMPHAARVLSGRYCEIKVPVHLIAGSDDAIVSTSEQSQRLKQELDLSSLEILEGVGHMTHHARPDLVLKAVDRLKTQTAAARQRKPASGSVAAQ
jgi:pimeloyl-ACP methyl ester carboxylesterase